jgi:hypothetical protein
MKKNNTTPNTDLLNEELKRFNSLTAYDAEKGPINEMNLYMPEEFFMDEDELLEADGDEEENEGGEDLGGDEGDLEGAMDDVAADLGDEEGGEEELDAEPDLGGDEEMDLGDEEMDLGDEEMDLGGEEMEDTSDDVEIDVTELVNSSEEAKESSEMANQKMEDLMGQFDSLSGQLQRMETLSSKIEDLEHEMETRMPTPEEKLEMRSLDSYPYNVKLTDYWADKEGQYNVMDGEDENSGSPKEYVLTQDDVDSEYNEIDVKDSLENPFEEEDI